MLDDVAAHLVEVVLDLGQVLVAAAQVVDQVADREYGDRLVELAQVLAHLALEARQLGHGVAQLFLQQFHGGAHLLLLRLRPLGEILGAHHLAVLDRRQYQPARRAHDGDRLRFRLLLDALEDPVVGGAKFGLQLGAPGAVLLALESARDGGLDHLDQLRHVVAERRAAPGRQQDHVGLVRLLEVVDVADVGRRRHLGRAALEELAHGGILAGARWARRKQVVALALDADAEADRVHGAALADDVERVLELVGGAEAERRDIAAMVKLVRVQCLGGGHGGRSPVLFPCGLPYGSRSLPRYPASRSMRSISASLSPR